LIRSCDNPAVSTVEDQVFRRVPLLAHLDETRRRRVRDAGRTESVEQGMVLFHEGSAATAMFVVLSGRLKLVRYTARGREMLLHLVGPGQSFAEAAVFGDATYPATAEALEDSVVWRLARTELLGLVRADPELGLALAASVSRWTRTLASQLELLTQRRVEERLAIYLLSRTGGRELRSGDVIPLAEPRHLIAAQCGTAPEVLSRTFRRLEEAGVFTARPDAVEVDDPARLQALAEWIED
jgi:CRP/FNR family transcriptional regulator